VRGIRGVKGVGSDVGWVEARRPTDRMPNACCCITLVCVGLRASTHPTSLTDADGDCHAWAHLFVDMYKAQGIDYANEAVPLTWTNGGTTKSGIIVKMWEFPEEEPYVNTSTASDPRHPTENKYAWTTARVTDKASDNATGQGPNTHPASLFLNHIVVDAGGQLYDPSYGVPYESLQGFDDQLSGFYRYKKLASGEYEWTFTKNSRGGLDVKELDRGNF